MAKALGVRAASSEGKFGGGCSGIRDRGRSVPDLFWALSVFSSPRSAEEAVFLSDLHKKCLLLFIIDGAVASCVFCRVSCRMLRPRRSGFAHPVSSNSLHTFRTKKKVVL